MNIIGDIKNGQIALLLYGVPTLFIGLRKKLRKNRN